MLEVAGGLKYGDIRHDSNLKFIAHAYALESTQLMVCTVLVLDKVNKIKEELDIVHLWVCRDSRLISLLTLLPGSVTPPTGWIETTFQGLSMMWSLLTVVFSTRTCLEAYYLCTATIY